MRSHELTTGRTFGLVFDSDYVGSGGLIQRSDLAGLNLAQIPAALVECANLRNPAEAALVSTSAGRA